MRIRSLVAFVLVFCGYATLVDAQTYQLQPTRLDWSAVTSAQSKKVTTTSETLEKWTFFASQEACKAAFESGEFRFYIPDPKHWKPLKQTAKGTPRPGCAHEVVRESKAGSPAWVLWDSNTPAEFGTDGLPVEDGRCWNPVDEFIYLELPRGRDGRNGNDGRNGVDGKNGQDGVNGLNGTNGRVVYVEPPHKKGFPWKKVAIIGGVVGGVAIGAYTKWYYSCPPGTTRRR